MQPRLWTNGITNNYNQDHKYQDHNQEDQCSYKHNVRFRPPRSRSQRLKGLLIVGAKKEEKENNNQYKDRDQEGHEQLQAQEMQDLDH